ncbi:MAG: serine O-acetyltransferase [Neisseria sp.]|uniref:serine O-acetyltransferase n=1 Tax=Neisseria sp. TaxID=192066 RepID=UPI0026DC80C7|nr:serine O-acetyltransferase [Neisseria sp.]MDO4640193.1 serine O-acetyltransferase [Neisseria sp.]
MKSLLLPATHLMLTYRISHKLYSNKLTRPLGYLVYMLGRMIFSSDIHPAAKIGKGSHFAHHYNITIGYNAVVGENCKIFNGVTLGDDGTFNHTYPTVGDNVMLATGVKLIGDVKVGSDSVIGANAVVVKDIPPSSLAVGVPAKVLRTIKRDEFYR